jgi:hypothetical protein
MPSDQGRILIVGSVARAADAWGVEDVLRNCAQGLGGHVSMLPDGEVGDRNAWINFIVRHAYWGHPDVITLSRHTYDDWRPGGYHDQWRITIRPGVAELHFPTIGYAAEAKQSYETFRSLRREGVIPAGVRFMVALPLTESGTRAFIDTARNFEVLWRGYRDAIIRELADIAAAIPHEDLAIQWDLARETTAVEGMEFTFPNAELTSLPTDPMDRYAHALAQVCPHIPDGVWLGLHVCYGSLGHKDGETPDNAHIVPIKDLNTAVDMLNRGVAAAGRRVDYVHMPVQFSAGAEDSFYRPLERLSVGDARAYIGLVDPSDGVAGALSRMEVARRYLPDFGIATPCGWGRRPPSESITGLLQLERAIADAAWPGKA